MLARHNLFLQSIIADGFPFLKLYLYSRIGTNENNMKMWTVLWTIIRKARNHCQDVDNCGNEDHCRYHLGIDHCQDREHCQNGNEHADR